MPSKSPPWPPALDGEAVVFWRRLQSKYGMHVDDIGAVRWPSEWRMHRANGMDEEAAWATIATAIDAIRAGRQPDPTAPGPYDAQWTPDVDGDCTPFVHALRGIYANEHPDAPQPVDPLGYVRWGSEFRMHRANGLDLHQAFEAILQAIRPIWKREIQRRRQAVLGNRPFVGPLRLERKMFRDDTGFRRVFGCSWFPALRILRDDPVEFERQMDVIGAYYHVMRTFLGVGGWSDFWDGREVAPISFRKWWYTGHMLRTDRLGALITAWSDYDDLLRTLFRACMARGIRLHLSMGDQQIMCADPNLELDVHRRLARIAAQEGGTDLVALAGDTNEFPINRDGSDSPASIAQMGRILQVWRSAIPGVLTAMGANPQNEEMDSLRMASTHGEVCIVHPTRGWPMTLKRTHALIHMEGHYRSFDKPFYVGEPAGPCYDSFAPLNDPAALTALYAMHPLTGMPSNQFSGISVRSLEPLENAWGFRELPTLLAQHLPEDIATWTPESNGRGGITYWWKDKDFRTSTCNAWDTSPPRPVADWTLFTGVSEHSGTGTPAPATGLLVGRFQ